MRGSFTVFAAVLKNWFRSKSGVFFSFLFPLMLLLIFGTIFGGTGDQSYSLTVQNNDLVDGQPTELSSNFVETLNSVGALNVDTISSGIDLDKYAGEDPSFETRRILVIPEGFQKRAMERNIYVRTGVILDTLDYFVDNYSQWVGEKNLESMEQGIYALRSFRENMSIENVGVVLLTSQGDTSAGIVQSIVSSVTNAFNDRIIGAESVVTIDTGEIVQRELDPVDYYLPGYIAAFIMTNGIIGVTTNFSEFRRNGVIKRLAATPLGKGSWIMGNLLHQALLAFILMVVMIGAGWAIFGVQAIPGVFALSLIFLGAVVFSSIGIVLGGMIKDTEAASAAGNAIGFPMMFLSGAFWPVEMMPSFMQSVAKAMPLYYFHEGLRELMIYDSPSGALFSFILYGSLAVVFVLLAIKVTKWKEF